MTDKYTLGNRLVFRTGAQRRFLQQVQEVLGVSMMAKVSGCSERSIRDWRREKFSISEAAAQKLSAISGIPIPASARAVPAYSHVAEAGKKGGAAVVAKYGGVPGSKDARTARWKDWWETEGKRISTFPYKALRIRKPRKSVRLAEFMGIVMGDGGITPYQVTVSLNSETDAEYIDYVSDLSEELFNVRPRIRRPKNSKAVHLVISRAELSRYLNSLGLPIGDKLSQGLDIPPWIIRKKSFAIGCLRGLVDTDGCVIIHRYRVTGKQYRYAKLDFTSISKELRTSVAKLLSELGMRPRLASRSSVRLESKADLARYFKIVGTSNPKHLNRYHSCNIVAP